MRTNRLALIAFTFLALAVTTAPAQAKTQTVVAVLYFDYAGGSEEMAFLRKGLNQMMVTDLVGTPDVTVVERERLEEILAELKLNKSNKIDRKSAIKAGKLLGARYLVMGGYYVFRGTLYVSVKVVDVETGAVVAARHDRSKSEDFWQLEQLLSGEVKKMLGKELAKRATKAPIKKTGPVRVARRKKVSRVARVKAVGAKQPAAKKLSVKTAARYGRALDAMDRGDKKSARKELESIVKETPSFDLAALDLASLAK